MQTFVVLVSVVLTFGPLFLLFVLFVCAEMGLGDLLVYREQMKDKRAVAAKMGWKLETHPGKYNHDFLMTMQGWESIKDLNPEAARGELAIYVYADGSVYTLCMFRDPQVEAIVKELVLQTKRLREPIPLNFITELVE